MIDVKRDLKFVAAIALSAAFLNTGPVQAQEFPFGLEITLEAARMPGSKRIPSLEIAVEKSCSALCRSQGSSGGGNTIVFVPGAMETLVSAGPLQPTTTRSRRRCRDVARRAISSHDQPETAALDQYELARRGAHATPARSSRSFSDIVSGWLLVKTSTVGYG
jgi:hypothetical protein